MAIFLKLFFFIDTDITNKFKSPGLTLTRKKFWFILNEQNKKIKRSGKNNSHNRRRAIVRKIAILLFVFFHPSVCAYQADADNILNHMSEVSAYAYILLECINFLFFRIQRELLNLATGKNGRRVSCVRFIGKLVGKVFHADFFLENTFDNITKEQINKIYGIQLNLQYRQLVIYSHHYRVLSFFKLLLQKW